jgi:hypothetical protein
MEVSEEHVTSIFILEGWVKQEITMEQVASCEYPCVIELFKTHTHAILPNNLFCNNIPAIGNGDCFKLESSARGQFRYINIGQGGKQNKEKSTHVNVSNRVWPRRIRDKWHTEWFQK